MKNRPLVALSSAAIVAVYAAGFARTRAAAERFDAPTPPRRPLTGVPERAGEHDRSNGAPRPEGRLELPAPTPASATTPRASSAARDTSPASAPPAAIAAAPDATTPPPFE